MNLKYVERSYPRWHKGGSRPSFCSCIHYGGSCTERIERGELTIVVIYIQYRNAQGKVWKKALRWRRECYLRMIPVFREQRNEDEIKSDDELRYWDENNPFRDERREREIEKEVERAKHPDRTVGRPRIRKIDDQLEYNKLSKKLASVSRRYNLTPKRTLTEEQRNRRTFKYVTRVAEIEIEMTKLDSTESESGK